MMTMPDERETAYLNIKIWLERSLTSEAHEKGDDGMLVAKALHHLPIIKPMGDAVTSEDKKSTEMLINDLLQKKFISPATSCKSCEEHEKHIELLIRLEEKRLDDLMGLTKSRESLESLNDFRLQEIAVLKSRCEGLVRALERVYEQSQRYWMGDGQPVCHEEIFQIVDDICRVSLSEHRNNKETPNE